MSEQEQIKTGANQPDTRVLVSYGKMATMGWFENKAGHIEKTRTKVVIKTPRGLEIGDVVGPFCYKHGHFKSTVKQVEDYYPDRAKDYPLSGGGQMVRYATEEDIMEAHHLDILAKDELRTCQKLADSMKLPMKVVDAEHLLGGERIIFYFISDNRIDFRELVKQLAREFQTRIELRQIGSRDEARIIGDYESCGLECCCRRFLKILAPVNMRMAKVQKATLDPSKISGHCGRLKCCLRYEDETYKVLKNRLPKKNTIVETDTGYGKVVDGQILTQLVVVEYEDGKLEASPVDEITIVKDKAVIDKFKKPPVKPQQRQGNDKRQSSKEVENENEPVNENQEPEQIEDQLVEETATDSQIEECQEIAEQTQQTQDEQDDEQPDNQRD